MILTPARIEVTAGEQFTSSVTVWPAGPRHVVNASAAAGSPVQVEVNGHKVTITGRLGHAGEQLAVHVTVRDDTTETAHDTLLIEATPTDRRATPPAHSPTC
ncbi:hypothetical protein [Streptomyces cylindrosporus]|uniref:Uncharacterized protein n=1 Tax=Streptomyces cylindrosporus TaxID=2927583 RepID=A0ABS9XY04_9ACTN|nr:hypothetical protein [Streptomyces cylindrosporus]MCI3269669.1 hypothetical protein [Streptomyces cylindrosporus]